MPTWGRHLLRALRRYRSQLGTEHGRICAPLSLEFVLPSSFVIEKSPFLRVSRVYGNTDRNLASSFYYDVTLYVYKHAVGAVGHFVDRSKTAMLYSLRILLVLLCYFAFLGTEAGYISTLYLLTVE